MKNLQRINETKTWLFERTNKIDKFLVKLTERGFKITKFERKRERLQWTLKKLRKSKNIL